MIVEVIKKIWWICGGMYYYKGRKLYNYMKGTRHISYVFLDRMLKNTKCNWISNVKSIMDERDDGDIFEEIKKELIKDEIEWPFMLPFKLTGKTNEVIMGSDNKIVRCMSSYAYLDLQYDNEIKEYAIKEVRKYSSGNIGPRMLCGNLKIYEELEEKIRKYFGYEGCLLCSTGYMACMSAIIGSVEGSDVLVVDAKIHDSLLSGAKLSGASIYKFKHNDAKELEKILCRMNMKMYRKILVVVESVYSMDGDICKYDEIYKVTKKNGAKILVDEAHGLGIIGENGRGIIGMYPDFLPDIICGTFSKSIGSIGGYICSDIKTIKMMHYATPGNMFTAPISVYNCAAAIKGFDKLIDGKLNDKIGRLQEKSIYFRKKLEEKGFNIGNSETCIIPIIFEANDVKKLSENIKKCIRLCNKILKAGYWITPVIYPACNLYKPRIRLMCSSDLSIDYIDKFVDTLEKENR